MNLNEVDKPEVKKTVVVYSGRFQPFHSGHYITYLKLCKQFGKNNVYIGTSNDTSGPKSPFNFNEKVKIMTKMFGVPSDKIVQVRNPYAPKEILSSFDGKTTQYIAAVGEKDADRLQGKYFKPYKGKAGYGYDEIGYVYPVPAEKNPISGTDVRNWLGSGDDENKKKGFLKAYPKFDKEIFKMITGKLNESVNTNPSDKLRPEPIPTRHQIEHPSDEPDWYKNEDLYDPIGEIIDRIIAEEIFEEFTKQYFGEAPNPIMDKEFDYTASDGSKKKIKVRSALRLAKDHPAHVQAQKMLGTDKTSTLAKGPDDAPANEPKKKEPMGKAATQAAKPSEPGQPTKQGQTTQGKIDKATTPTSNGETPEAPNPQKLSGTELKSSAEKRVSGETPTQTAKQKETKEKLNKAISELHPNEQKEVEASNNPDSPERKAMAEQAESGWQRFKKSTMVGRFLAKKQKQYSDTGDAIKNLANFKRLGTIKNSEGKDVHWRQFQKKDENGEPMFDKKPVYEKATKIVKDKDGIDRDAKTGRKVDKDGNKLGNDGKPIHATNLLGQKKYEKTPIWRDDLTDEEKHLAHESHHKSHEQKHALLHTGIEAGFLVTGVAMAGGIAAGVGVIGKTIAKDVGKHAALEVLGVENPLVAGGAGLAAAHYTHHLLEGMYLNENTEEVNTQKLFENIVQATIEKFKTYKLSDEQLLKCIEQYKKDKPKEDLANLLKEDLSDSKKQNIQHFVEFATKRLKLKEAPKVTLISGKEFANAKSSLGGYNPDSKEIFVSTEGRLTADILRTIAHEMAHRRQDELGLVTNPDSDGADGSDVENKAHAVAGVLMREYGRINKQIYNEDVNVDVDKGDEILMGKFKNKKVTVKDIGTDDHGMPTINGKQATTFRIPRGEHINEEQPHQKEMVDGIVDMLNQVENMQNRKEMALDQLNNFKKEGIVVDETEFLNRCGLNSVNEVGSNDWRFKAIMKMWDSASSFGRKKIGAAVCKDPKADRNDIARELRSFGYRDITSVGDELGLDEKKNLNELTQGLFAGKVKIGGVPVDLEVELLGADNKTKEFVTRVIHIDKKYQHKLPIGSEFRIPARIFRMPGGGWHKIKSSAFKESLNEVKWEDTAYDKCMLGKLPLSLNIIQKLVEPIRTTSLHATDVENLSTIASLQGSKKSISTFNKTSKYGKLVQGKGMHTKGGIIVAVSGVVLAQSIMDLWTEPDKQGRRWVNPGTIIANLGREQDVVFNFAPELKKYKEEWQKNMYDKPATNQEKAEFIKKYYDAADRYMLSKKKEFQEKYLNSNALYYDSDWNEVVLSQIKIESILVVPWLLKTNVKVGSWDFDMENKEDTEKTIQKLKQKYKNVVVAKDESDISNFITTNGGSIINESINKNIISEGGAYGHMSHPFDDMDLTFGDLKKIIKGALTGNLELTREKTDGQALAISWKNGRLIAARNKGHLANAGANAMGIEDVASKFAGRGGLTDAYNFAMKDLSTAIQSLSEAQRKKIFNEGQCFMNLEVIWPTSVNVIPYGQALLVFHNTTCYDESGKAISADQSAAGLLAKMIKQVNADVQSKYTIQGPPITELPKNEDLSSKQTKYLTQLQKIQFQFQLSDKDGVSEYHQAWWEDFVNKSKVKLQKLEKEALVRRWAFGDKSFRLNTIADKEAQKWAMDNDKVNVAKQQKENVRQFEEIFLGVGADVLSFMGSVLTANPDEAVAKMKQRLKDTAEKVRGSGDPSKIAKLKMELSRLNSIGGSKKIVPNEGIVFVYNGNTYKLTGTFAPLNQILGIFYE